MELSGVWGTSYTALLPDGTLTPERRGSLRLRCNCHGARGQPPSQPLILLASALVVPSS
jgi:hypothetical protein